MIHVKSQISPIGCGGALLLSTSPGFVITTEYQSQTLEKCWLGKNKENIVKHWIESIGWQMANSHGDSTSTKSKLAFVV